MKTVNSLTEQLLDDRNMNYWNEISEVFHPSIQLYDGKYCHYHIFQSTVQFFIPAANSCRDTFTHELLHVWLRSKGIFITEFLLRQLKEAPLLCWSFSEHLFQQIGHSLEHVKMLPYFIEAGCTKEMFSEEDQQFRFTTLQLQIIRSGMVRYSKVPLSCLDLYINRFFALKSLVNDQFDGREYLNFLSDVRPELFLLLDEFWNRWAAFEIQDSANYSYKSFTSHFIHQLGKWAVEAIHAKPPKINVA